VRVVVTGGAGFLGSHLCFSLAGAGHTVLSMDDLSHGVNTFTGQHAKKIDFQEIDVSNTNSVSMICDFKADAVFHLADVSAASPAFDTGLFGKYSDALTNVLQASVAAKVKKFVYASSADYLFGRQCEMPVNDATKSMPANLYGVHKYACERQVSWMASKHHLRWAALRLPYVYGPSARHLCKRIRRGYCFVSEALLRRRRYVLRIASDGNQSRDFLWIADAVSAMEMAMRDRCLVGAVNVGTGIETSINKVLAKLEELKGRKLRVERLYKKKDDVPRSRVDSSVMREHRWQPKTGIVSGLEILVANGVETTFDEGDAT